MHFEVEVLALFNSTNTSIEARTNLETSDLANRTERQVQFNSLLRIPRRPRRAGKQTLAISTPIEDMPPVQ